MINIKQNELDKAFEKLANDKEITDKEAYGVICRLMSNATHNIYDDDTLYMTSELYNYNISMKKIPKEETSS